MTAGRFGRSRLAVEALVIAAIYAAYSVVRNRFGSANTAPEEAYANALRVIEWERRLNALVELDVQNAFVTHIAFIQFWNLYYGLFHFAFTLLALTWALLRLPAVQYRWWRNVLASMTGFGLVGYAVFPLMPPRLLANCGRFGACTDELVFVDTVTEIGGIWSFESEAVQAVTNQYAAMPSLHFGWALWVAALVATAAPRRTIKVAALLHPWATLFGITVTGNHWWLDAVGGAAAFGLGLAVAALVQRMFGRAKVAGAMVNAGSDGTIVGGDGPDATVFT